RAVGSRIEGVGEEVTWLELDEAGVTGGLGQRSADGRLARGRSGVWSLWGHLEAERIGRSEEPSGVVSSILDREQPEQVGGPLRNGHHEPEIVVWCGDLKQRRVGVLALPADPLLLGELIQR